MTWITLKVDGLQIGLVVTWLGCFRFFAPLKYFFALAECDKIVSFFKVALKGLAFFGGLKVTFSWVLPKSLLHVSTDLSYHCFLPFSGFSARKHY